MAEGVNNTTQIVGAFADFTAFNRGYLTPDQGGSFTTIRVPGSASTTAFGINGPGQIVGSYGVLIGPSFQQLHGFLTTNNGATFTPIDIGSSFTSASGNNDLGHIAGIYANGGSSHGFFTANNGATFTPIDIPGATATGASKINNADWIAGFYDDPSFNEHGFVTPDLGATHITIDPPGSTGFTDANGINNLNQIVGNFSSTTGVHGFLTTDLGATYSQIDFPGATRTEARAINDAGQIVGDYYDASNVQHGFLATPELSTVPEPTTLALVGSGMAPVAFGVLRRRTRVKAQP